MKSSRNFIVKLFATMLVLFLLLCVISTLFWYISFMHKFHKLIKLSY